MLFKAGELTSVDTIINKQIHQKEKILYGVSYNPIEHHYKFKSTVEKKPDVLVLGNSRVLQFREDFFNKDVSFYNAGLGGENLSQFYYFLQNLPKEHLPRMILFGLDHAFFNPQWSGITQTDMASVYSYPNQYKSLAGSLFKIWRDYFSGKFSVAHVFKNDLNKFIGLQAIEKKNGYRSDGSHYNKQIYDKKSEPLQIRFEEALERIKEGGNRFEPSDIVSERSMDELSLILDFCHAHQIQVIGFFQPFPQLVFDTIKANESHFGYFKILPQMLDHEFRKRAYDFYDFSSFQDIGAMDNEALDGLHPSEKATLRLFLKIVQKTPVLQGMVQEAWLQEQLQNSKDDFYIFPNS